MSPRSTRRTCWPAGCWKGSYLDRPFDLFGQSMGALIAFELARQLRAKCLEPVQVFASDKAPHLPSDRSKHRRHLPDRKFIAAVGGINGIPREVGECGSYGIGAACAAQ
jgi:surfactin synthase thioesterase subunit